MHGIAWRSVNVPATTRWCISARCTDYAQQLVDLARSLGAARLTAAVPLTRKNTLEKRVKALFDERRSHQPLSGRLASLLLAGGLVVLTGLAVVHPGPSIAGQQPKATAAVAPAQEKAPAAAPNGAIHETYTHPITVTGRALDLTGKPISGARIYMASRLADYRRVAETTTDVEGYYELRDVKLPIELANTRSGRDEGVFQVFGEADGFGFAWRPVKWFFPGPKPGNIAHEPEHRDPPSHYEANDKIALDLRFPPPARLFGTVVDDQGTPLPRAQLEIRGCESLKVVDNVVGGWPLDTLNERDSAPPSMKLRTTDAQGRFEFTGMPVDCRFWIHVRVQDFQRQSFYAATTDAAAPDHDGAPVLTGLIKVVLVKPVDVPIKLVYGDTGEPAPRLQFRQRDWRTLWRQLTTMGA